MEPPRLLGADVLREIRLGFPVLGKTTYLNTGTYGPMPTSALRTYLTAVEELERDGIACGLPLAQAAEDLRAVLAAMVRCEPHELAYTGNATDGINAILSGTDWEPGDEVITTDEEHEAMLHPLLYLQKTRGIRVRRVSCSHVPDVMVTRLNAVRSINTRLLAFSHVTCETGTLLPAAAMCAWAAEHGIRTLLDVAQSLGAASVNVEAIGCDFMAGNGHKWLHGPTGTGVVYVRNACIEEVRPAHVGAGSLREADAQTGVAEPWATSARFEFGTRPWARATGWKASLDWLNGIGHGRIAEHMLAIGSLAIEMLSAIPGLEVLTPRSPEGRAGLISVRCIEGDAGRIGARLTEEHAIIVRHVPHYNALRFSMSHFTDEDDIVRLNGAMQSVLEGARARGEE